VLDPKRWEVALQVGGASEKRHPGRRARAAIDIKRGLSALPEKGFFVACEDLKPARRFVVNSGTERRAVSEDLEVVGLRKLALMLAEM
jgi:hypothetical protein